MQSPDILSLDYNFKKRVLLELHYLPCVSYFAALVTSDYLQLDSSDKYWKQSYRNRCRILGANKVEDLVVPVIRPSGTRPLTSEIRIDYGQKWENKHRRAIISAYGKAPYFDYYAEEILNVYTKHYPLLWELNTAFLKVIVNLLRLKILVVEEYEASIAQEKFTMDLRGQIHPKRTGAVFLEVKFQPYYQLFSNSFVENLSILDLIFNEGPGTLAILKKTATSVDKFDK